jgi:RNA methyltransferase, TrmH family
MLISLGAHSPKIDELRALLTPKGRREHNRFLIEGSTMLAEALESNLRPEAIYAVSAEVDCLPAAIQALDIPTYLVPERTMARISRMETPPGILAILPSALRSLAALFTTGQALALLAGVADPGNAGTLLRSAEIFGIKGVIFGSNGIEPYNPKVVRASMGAIFHLDLAIAHPEELISLARSHGYTVIATSQAGTPLPTFSFPKKPIIAIGNERRGVASWLPTWDKEISIPHIGNVESLNAAIAGSILFYIFSQQRVHPLEVA